MLEFQAHICWVITVGYKVRLGQVKSQFNWKRPKLTRSVRASKLSIFSIESYSVEPLKMVFVCFLAFIMRLCLLPSFFCITICDESATDNLLPTNDMGLSFMAKCVQNNNATSPQL